MGINLLCADHSLKKIKVSSFKVDTHIYQAFYVKGRSG